MSTIEKDSTYLPVRKPNRLSKYDYKKPGAYFITICTQKGQHCFWDPVDKLILTSKDVVLSEEGKIVDNAIKQILLKYSTVSVDHYVIMPNHIHLLLQIKSQSTGDHEDNCSVSRIINQLKGAVTKSIGYPIWQKLYYDHVIRNSEEYSAIAEYIFKNPMQWQRDTGNEEYIPYFNQLNAK